MEKSEVSKSKLSTVASPPDSTGSSAPERTSASRGAVRPADVHEHGVAERRPLADELAVAKLEIGEIPVQPRVEARREPGRDVRGEHGRAEEHGVRALALDERRERVHARLRERGRERRVLAREDLRGAERTGLRGDGGRVLPEHDAGRLAERRRLPEHAEPALLELAVVVLEEDEEVHAAPVGSGLSLTPGG